MSYQEITTVPLEDWFEELADEGLDPLNILINEEDEETDMSTTTLHMNKQPEAASFDIKKWLATAAVVTNGVANKAKVYATPEWLTLKSGVVCEENAFVVTAGVIKAARQIIDAIAFESRRHEELVEQLTVQEHRAVATGKFTDPSGPSGYNPDGNEYAAALEDLAAEIDKVENVLANGERLMQDVLEWIAENAEDLNLRVQTGYTTRTGIIGNEIRTPRYELLTPETLMFGIAQQRDFIKNNR